MAQIAAMVWIDLPRPEIYNLLAERKSLEICKKKMGSAWNTRSALWINTASESGLCEVKNLEVEVSRNLDQDPWFTL